MIYAPVPDEDWPPELEAMRGSFATKLHVYRVMAHHPSLLLAWRNLRDHLVGDTALDNADMEIVILRTGHRQRSAYEWAHHVVRARAAGLSDERIAATSAEIVDPADRDALLIRAADELIGDAKLSETTLTDLTRRVGKKGVLDIMAIVGMYTTLSFIVNTFQTPLDADIARSLYDAPLLGADPLRRSQAAFREN